MGVSFASRPHRDMLRTLAEGKTDYRARKRLVAQEKNKYLSHRFRFVVRFTNTTVITQIIYAEIDGDKVLTSAYSSELPRYGLPVGLKNYAAAYATGLLLARRTLKKLGMDSEYKGNTNIDGNVFQPEVLEERRPFKALLDVGTRATTTGARLFGALKGASDGGFFVPHNEKRFPGYDRAGKEYNADVHRQRIFGQHVAEYMKSLAEDDSERYAKQFSQFIAKDIDGAALEALYKKTHEVCAQLLVCWPIASPPLRLDSLLFHSSSPRCAPGDPQEPRGEGEVGEAPRLEVPEGWPSLAEAAPGPREAKEGCSRPRPARCR